MLHKNKDLQPNVKNMIFFYWFVNNQHFIKSPKIQAHHESSAAIKSGIAGHMILSQYISDSSLYFNLISLMKGKGERKL